MPAEIDVSCCQKVENILKIHQINGNDANEVQFTVCVKGMDFASIDLTYRLTEWLEVLKVLGADKVVMYEYANHPNVQKLLTYYESIGVHWSGLVQNLFLTRQFHLINLMS